MKRNEILAVYHQGPEAVVQLENQGKKTPKTATSRLLPTNFISRNRKAFGKKPIGNLVDSRVLTRAEKELRRSGLDGPQSKTGKQHPAKNLYDRFKRYTEEVLAFLAYPLVSFDNNQAERDMHMVKTKQKISGTFRSDHGPQTFCRLRGLISAAQEQGHNVL